MDNDEIIERLEEIIILLKEDKRGQAEIELADLYDEIADYDEDYEDEIEEEEEDDG